MERILLEPQARRPAVEEQSHAWRRARSGLAIAAGLALLTAVVLLLSRLNVLENQLTQLEHSLQDTRAAASQQRTALDARITLLTQERDALQKRVNAVEAELQTACAAVEKAQQALEAEKTKQQALETETPQQVLKQNQANPYSYRDLYPDLYATPAQRETLAPDKTAYLTFDDGPSARTAEILDILQENQVKATFFVTGQTSAFSRSMMKRIVDEGHTIAVHTYTHKYKTVYASVESYLEDFYRVYSLIHETTGVYPQIFRFPGGTVNSFNKKLCRELVAEMNRRGFVHYDWNATSGDADGKRHTPEELAQNALAKVGASRAIVLMHDSTDKSATVASLQAIIDGYRNAGFSFAPLSPEVKAITFD